MELIKERKFEAGSNFSKLFYGDLKTLREYGFPAQNKILKMSNLCKKNKIPLIVLVFSSEHGFTDRESHYDDNRIDYSFPTKVLSGDLQNKGVNVIDFWPLMNKNCYLIQDAHYNGTGHDIVFNVLNSMLIKNL